MSLTRRDLLGRGAAGLVLVPIGGALAWQTPAQAVAAKAGYRTLTTLEASWLSGLGEAIAPPSGKAGLAHYVDHHLTVPPAKSLLGLRYLDVPPPYVDFYRPALAQLARLGTPYPSGDPRWTALLATLGSGGGPDWQAAPAPLFLFVVRLDAVDIAYGTRAGFARLGVEYLPHIEPETDW